MSGDGGGVGKGSVVGEADTEWLQNQDLSLSHCMEEVVFVCLLGVDA